MRSNSAVDFIEEWQQGAAILLASVVGGAVTLIVAAQFLPAHPFSGLIAFFGGAALSFLVLAYFLYGRPQTDIPVS